MSQKTYLHQDQVGVAHNQSNHLMKPYEGQWYHHQLSYLQTSTGHCTGTK